jgi:hypothetical protein
MIKIKLRQELNGQKIDFFPNKYILLEIMSTYIFSLYKTKDIL